MTSPWGAERTRPWLGRSPARAIRAPGAAPSPPPAKPSRRCHVRPAGRRRDRPWAWPPQERSRSEPPAGLPALPTQHKPEVPKPPVRPPGKYLRTPCPTGPRSIRRTGQSWRGPRRPKPAAAPALLAEGVVLSPRYLTAAAPRRGRMTGGFCHLPPRGPPPPRPPHLGALCSPLSSGHSAGWRPLGHGLPLGRAPGCLRQALGATSDLEAPGLEKATARLRWGAKSLAGNGTWGAAPQSPAPTEGTCSGPSEASTAKRSHQCCEKQKMELLSEFLYLLKKIHVFRNSDSKGSWKRRQAILA
ncbi:basic proline-rich protein-like [Pseudopipra pipra]|uniref:basic proline-rich protein-like n=1 Tax=Pseudopipra pipra TaxID=415032 RepID=UPI003138CD26